MTSQSPHIAVEPILDGWQVKRLDTNEVLALTSTRAAADLFAEALEAVCQLGEPLEALAG